MAITRCLGEAIKAFRAEGMDQLDKPALELLARLEKSSEATKAFERLMKERRPPRIISPPRSNYNSQQKAAELLTICIAADGCVRNFRLEIAKAETTLVRAVRLDRAIAELRKFVGEQRHQVPSSVWGLSAFEPPADIAALKYAVDLIARQIEWSRGVANATIAQLGATRKRRSKEAAYNAAIWCLGAQVPTVIGWPPWQEVADLAQVILKTEVSAERVRQVVRKGGELYAEMIGSQTKRYFREKIAEARRPSAIAQASGAFDRGKTD